MKSTKQVKQTFLQNLPVLDHSPPGLKKKGKPKYETEPMVLMTSDAPENIAQYCIDIPSVNKDRVLDEMDMLKNITVHLNQIVQTMELVYTKDDKIKEERKGEETLPREREDLVCFLIYCSQLSNQLDAALLDEKQILESLLKWFEKEVQMLEELGEEQILPDWQIPVPDKNITDNIHKLMDRIQRLEDLKGRVQELPKYIRASTPREKRRQLATPPAVLRDPKNIIEELAMKHATDDVMNMVQVFQDDSGAPQTIESMNSRMIEIMKIFERQTNKLHRVTNEQDVLESKLQKIQQDFRKLAEEKQIMEDELQKMKITDKTVDKTSADARKKLLAKLETEKAKIEERTGAQPEKGKKSLGSQKVKDSEAVKMKEDLAKAQADIQFLEREKKMLEEKLQKVLEEADTARGQLAEIPPNIPDWEFPHAFLEENEKDLSKKSKKGAKLKGKASVTDGGVQKVTKFDTVKPGEKLPEKDQEISIAPQAKDVKGKKKGTDLSEIERSSLHKTSSAISEKLPKQPGKSETPSKADSKGILKHRVSVELKKPRSAVKGTGKRLHGSAETVLPPLTPDQEQQLLPDSTDQQAESVETTSEKQKKMRPAITSSTELQKEETLPVIEPESVDLVSSSLAVPEEFMGESEQSLILEQATAIPRTSLRTWTDPTGFQEVEIRNLIDEGLLQLVDHLTELKEMPEAETLAKLLLEPSKGIEMLTDAQKLQLINQLIAPDGQQQAQFPIPIEEDQIVEQREKKRHVLANIVSTLNLLDQMQAEAGQTEKEVNEMAKVRRILFTDLESNLKDLNQAQVVVPIQQELENKINELTKKRSLLITALESNARNLKEAQAIAATQPSEMSKNKVKELLQERAALTACLEADEQELQRAKSQEAILAGKVKHEEEVKELSEKKRMLLAELEKNLNNLQEAQAATEPSITNDERIKELIEQRKLFTASLETNLQELERAQAYVPGQGEESRLKQEEINELSEKRKTLLDNLKSNLKDLEETQALAAIEPSTMNDERIKELIEQRKLFTASLETNLQELERAQAYVPGQGEESRLKQEEINELSEKRKTLLDNLKSNLKDLQETQALAAIEPSTMNDEKIKDLTEQRKLLVASIETNLQDLQRTQGYVPGLGEDSRLKEIELNEQSEKKRLLQERLESNLRDLQQAQMLAITQPDRMNELKLCELIEERKNLTTELEAAVHTIQGIQHEKELNALSQKKQLLLKNLESNLKDLRTAQALAADEPGSITEHELQELTEQRRNLAADLDAALHRIDELQHQDEVVKTPEMELQELSAKKELLLGKLESTLKELQQAQALTSAEAGGVGEQKLQELIEQRRQLTAEIESAIFDMQEIQLRDEIQKSSEKEAHKLLEKKQFLFENLVSTLKELQEAQAAEAAQPGSISEETLQLLREKGRHLTADLEATVLDIKKTQHPALGRAELVIPGDWELRDLSERKQFLLQNLTSNLKELEQVQALAGSELDSFSENDIQQLNEQRKLLSVSLDTIIQQIKEIEVHRVPETPKMPVVLKMDLNQLSEYKRLFLKSLESNLKDLQEAQILATIHPGSITEQKVQELIEERRLLAAGLKTIIEDNEDAKSQALDKDAIMRARDIILEELYQKQRLILENLESNRKDLQQAEALAAAQPGGMGENKIKELTEQRRLLATGLEAIMQDIQEAEGLDRHKLEILKIIEEELPPVAELSENRKKLWENVELNLNDLKGSQVLALTESDGMQKEEKQMLAEQRKRLVANLEALLQDMEEAQNLVLSGSQISSPDGRNINEIKRLESKLDEIQQKKVLSDIQLDSMKRKLCELKEKSGLDRWDVALQGPPSLTKEELPVYGLDDEAAGKLLGKRRYVSPSLQKSFRNLQQKSIRDMQRKGIRDLQQRSVILQGKISDKELYRPIEDKTTLEECLVSIPLKMLEDDTAVKYGPDDEQLAMRRALVAKLEANMRDLHGFHEAQQMRKAREKPTSETSSELLKPTESGLQLQISKVPEGKKHIPRHDIAVPEQLIKLQKKDTELELRKHFMQQVKRLSLTPELTMQKQDMYSAMQEILDANKGLLPAYKANLPQALVREQFQLQQANLIAAQKLLYTQPPGPSTARFHEYTVQPPRPVWEGNQLPATDYLHKLMVLKKKLLSPELKGLLAVSSSSFAQMPTSSATEEMDSMLICGKGYGG